MADLISSFNLRPAALGHLTSAVQFGFICGTLLFALFTIADRFPPSRVFFLCAILGGICNLGTLLEGNSLSSLLSLRFLTGFFLAGIYPVGMKIAADYFDKGLGKSLGFLVGALVLGTALPHLLKSSTSGIPWVIVIWITSGFAFAGGFMMWLLVPNGPFRKGSSGFDFSSIYRIFKIPGLRAAAFGYFGHMWELYAFWAFVPVMIVNFNNSSGSPELPVSLLSFAIIGIGGLGCVISGLLSETLGSGRAAVYALALSCACCLLSPLVLGAGSTILLLVFLLLWGFFVVADSPMFSTLVAQNSPAQIKGTALTIVNCIGFALTIFSIQLLNFLRELTNPKYLYLLLALGPMLGLLSLMRNKNRVMQKK